MRKLLLTVIIVFLLGCSIQHRTQVGDAAAIPVRGLCDFTQRAGAGTIVIGQLILASEDIRFASLYIDRGLIQAIGDETVLTAQYPAANVLRCQNAYVSSGFINAHEHTSYSYSAPIAGMQPYYVHRDEWRLGLNQKGKVNPPSTSDLAVLAWVELRHLLSGVTTVAGSGAIAGFVKNASRQMSSEYEYVIDAATFPFGMTAMERFSAFPCNADPTTLPAPTLTTGVPVNVPFVPHIGEGTHCTAELEIDAYLNYLSTGAPERRYSLIHGLGLKSKHIDVLRSHGVAVIWSPRSNIALYADTLDGSWLLDQGVSVALGTDWSPSGSYNIFQEMQCAIAYSQSASRVLKGRELWQMVTHNAAYSLAIESITGTLTVGKAADIVIVDGISNGSLENFGMQSPNNVLAVFVDGRLLTFDEQRVNAPTLSKTCPHLLEDKRLCIDFSTYSFTFEEMIGRNHGNVGLFDLVGQAACESL